MDAMKNAAAKLTGKSESRALPEGSTILVTGASGYIGSHVVQETLNAGYKVVGTARSEEKAQKTKALFQNHPNYSTTVVEDFQHEGAFDEAMKDVDSVIHVASDVTMNPDPSLVVKPVVAGVLSVLRSAAKSPSVKRFVLTSSSTAVSLPKPNKEFTLTKDQWNQEAIDIAWAPPPYTEERAYAVYAASKTEGEQALWKFVKEEKPNFIVNAVLPNFNMGRIFPGGSAGATGGNIPSLYKGEKDQWQAPQYMIDVIDDARLHLIAAALDPSLTNERIFAYNVPFNWTQIIEIVKELHPNATSLPQPPENEPRDLSKVPNELGAKLLKEWYGQDGYKPLKQSVKENLEGQI